MHRLLIGLTLALCGSLSNSCRERAGCLQQPEREVVAESSGPGRTTAAVIAGNVFHLEVAASEASQRAGLSGRDHIGERSGMLFVFPEPQWQSFVMRDCAIPIDLVYLDHSGRVDALYAMVPEASRSAEENPNDPVGDAAYHERLTTYPSRASVSYAVELRGGTIADLGIHEGDLLELDYAAIARVCVVPHAEGR